MEVKVYDITTIITERELTDEQIANINILFDELAGENSNQNHIKVSCILSQDYQREDVILYEYLQGQSTYDFKRCAQKLLEAESTKARERNKNIPEGFLFIKQDDNRLVLMKMEKTNVVDTNTFAKRGELGMDKDYYKLCVFPNDFNNITVIDKNQKAAKYWYNKFLNLELLRTEDDNTRDLVDLVENDEFFKDEIKELPNFSEIKSATKEFIFDNNVFDKTRLKDFLVQNSLIDAVDERQIYSDRSTNLDSDFSISKSVLKEKYKKTLKISEETIIRTDNFEKLKRRQRVFINADNELVLKVDSEFLEQLKLDLGV